MNTKYGNKFILNNDELNEHWETINHKFPFNGYINQDRKSGYFDMVKKVVKWTGTKNKVLDFGAGPCDKTALFSLVGMDVTAFDTLEDAWHLIDDNRRKILDFAQNIGIKYSLPTNINPLPIFEEEYDSFMAHDVLEHFHSSPRILMNKAIECVKEGGIIAITVPNAANIRKRLHLLLGKTNYPKYEYFYWYPGPWCGHVREYVYNDLYLLNKYLGLELLEISTYNLQLDVLPKYLQNPYKIFASFFPKIRDSWMLISRKPKNWSPKIEPNSKELEDALGSQYFDYSNHSFDWNKE